MTSFEIKTDSFGWYWLSTMVSCGIANVETFVGLCQDVDSAMYLSPGELERIRGIPDGVKKVIRAHLDPIRAAEDFAALGTRGIGFVGRGDPGFPEVLKDLKDCPLGLFFCGRSPSDAGRFTYDGLRIAMVGARDATDFGTEMAYAMARDLTSNGVCVISGLARGIDGWAHRGALEGSRDGGDAGMAVLGCGVDICYPRSQISLAAELKERGTVLSEFPPGTPPVAWHFPYRNRLIAALCEGVVVVEARKLSGSLITAGQALDLGRDVFAVPGRPVDPLSAGCLCLIDDGARPVCGAGDILNWYGKTEQGKFQIQKLDGIQEAVYACLNLEPESIQSVAERTRLTFAMAAKTLMDLEYLGMARQVGRNRFIRRL